MIGPLARQRQQVTVSSIGNVFAVGHVIQQLRQVRPNSELVDLPRMSVQMPNSAVLQHVLEHLLSDVNPGLRSPALRHTPHEARNASGSS